jgi:hypothetical protein
MQAENLGNEVLIRKRHHISCQSVAIYFPTEIQLGHVAVDFIESANPDHCRHRYLKGLPEGNAFVLCVEDIGCIPSLDRVVDHGRFHQPSGEKPPTQPRNLTCILRTEIEKLHV